MAPATLGVLAVAFWGFQGKGAMHFITELGRIGCTLRMASCAPYGLEIPLAPRGLEDEVVHVTAVGDILFTEPMQKQAARDSEAFLSFWKELTPLFAEADLSYANLEGSVAPTIRKYDLEEVPEPSTLFDGSVYSGYPFYNYHPRLLADLASSGIDILSTANNHAMDRGEKGLAQTLDQVARHRLIAVGTARREDAANLSSWYRITEVKGLVLAWVACTQFSNLPDPHHLVLPCGEESLSPLLKSVMDTLAASPSIDAIIVTPHWGYEDEYVPEARQEALARQMVDAGALLVLGSHPHVVQPWRFYSSPQRQSLVVFSLGNFTNGRKSTARRTSAVFHVKLAKSPQGKAAISDFRFTPFRLKYELGRFFIARCDAGAREELLRRLSSAHLDPACANRASP